MHLFGFIIRIYHDARSPERQFITMHGHLNVNLSRCAVTWTSIYHDAVTWTSIYHDAHSPERQFITMHSHLNVNLSRCTVTWTSIYHDARSPERQFITMHGHLNVKFLNLCLCKMTWTRRYVEASDFLVNRWDAETERPWTSRSKLSSFRLVATSHRPPLHNATSGYNSGSKMGVTRTGYMSVEKTSAITWSGQSLDRVLVQPGHSCVCYSQF